MARMPNTKAIYDVLTICDLIGDSLNGISKSEFYYFTYLSCLLSLYDGNPVADWEYQFVTTKWGTPYSREIQEAVELLISGGSTQAKGNIVLLTSLGRDRLHFFRSLIEFKSRRKYIRAACSSALALPLGLFRHALHQEPTIRSANTRESGGALLDDAGPSIQVLYEQFGALNSTLGEHQSNLLGPSVAWLQYLIEIEEANREIAERSDEN